MKKTYLTPALDIIEAQVSKMLAESLPINNDTTLDGNEALTKQQAAWDIWGE